MKGSIVLLSLAGAIVTSSFIDIRDHCEKDCAKFIAGSWSNSQSKSMFLSDCNSYMGTTIVPATATVVETSTVTLFAGNDRHNPTFRQASIEVPASQITITATQLPAYLSKGPCKTGNKKSATSQYVSACSCAGATSGISTQATTTTTVVQQVPTTIPEFRLAIVDAFKGTASWIRVRVDSNGHPLAYFTTDLADATLFELGSDSKLNALPIADTYAWRHRSTEAPGLVEFNTYRANSKPMEAQGFYITLIKSENGYTSELRTYQDGKDTEYAQFFDCGGNLCIATPEWAQNFFKNTTSAMSLTETTYSPVTVVVVAES